MQRLQAAVALHNQGELDQAEAIYRNILTVDMNNFYALNFYGCICRERKRFDEGIDLLSRATSLQPGNPDAFYNLGNVLKDAERWNEAISCYEKTLGLRAEYPEALNNLGICLMEVERYEHSEIVLSRAVSMQPDFAGAWLNLGNTFKEQDKLEQAIGSYRKAIEEKPDFADAYLALGIFLKEVGEVEEAIRSYRKAIEVKPDFADAYLALGIVLKKGGEVEEAIRSYRKAIEVNPDFADVYLNLGNALKEEGEVEEAIRSYRKAIEVKPDFADAYLNLGNVLKEGGEVEEAIAIYRKAIEVKADFADVYLNLGIALKEEGEVEEAIRSYRKAIEVKPDFADAYLNLGNVLKEGGEVEKAIASYRKAIEVKPDFADAYLNLGNVLKEGGEAEEAIGSYRKAIEVNPDFAGAYLNLGNVLKEGGEVEKAIASYRKAIEVKPDFVGALSQLASELTKRDEYEEAISLYKRALAEDPKHVNSIPGLGWCFLKSNRSEEAITYYTNLLLSSPGDTDALFFLFEVIRGEMQGKLKQDFSYSTNFLQKCLEFMCVSRIVAFGDSHVQLFKGFEEITLNHVGASTAYNLAEEDSSTGGRRQVLNRIGRMNPKVEAVLLCFGEVDIRANVIKYCYQKGMSIQECVDGVVSRYISFAAEIASRGFKILIYGGYGAGGDRNSVGSDRERNFAAKCLNTSLQARCEQIGFVYFSLHDALLDEEGLETDSSFLSDGSHLHNGELTAQDQVQTLLFERASKSAKSVFGKQKYQSPPNLVLGNVGVSRALRVGSLESGCLSWDIGDDSLYSVIFDLGGIIRFESINLELEADLEIDSLSLTLDGRLLKVNVLRESSCRWNLRLVDQSVPFVGRYPMLKASSDFLISLKGFSVDELSLV